MRIKSHVLAGMAALAAAAVFTASAHAEPTEAGNVVIDYMYEQEPLQNVPVSVYQIAGPLDGEVKVFEAFETETDLNAPADMQQTAADLLAAVKRSETLPLLETQTGMDGLVQPDGLEPGIYLVDSAPVLYGNTVLEFVPLLFAVGEEGVNQDIHAYAKFTCTEVEEETVDQIEPEEPAGNTTPVSPEIMDEIKDVDTGDTFRTLSAAVLAAAAAVSAVLMYVRHRQGKRTED